jgi:pimeloyl-ACP methyl ester carboxylesterase
MVAPRRNRARRTRLTAASVAALAGLLTAAGCTATVDGTGQKDASTVPFTSCASLFPVAAVPVPQALTGQLTFGCATLAVPLDYSDPSGRTISLQLLRIHDAGDTHPIGSLLVDPGGPGGSGVSLALGLISQMNPEIVQHFDIVGFDPRGVGASDPITCENGKQEDALTAASPNMATRAGRATVERDARRFDSACNAKYGTALGQFNTVNTARDMDRIRAAVGDDQLNYLGFSYGTELGAAYAHLFPSRVRVAVLDGAVDPLTSGVTRLAQQYQGFEDAFDQFAANCATVSPCRSLGNARRAAERVLSSAQRHPLATGTSRKLTGSLASTGILEALYSRSEWVPLGAALISATHGNGGGLLALADQYYQRQANGTYGNILDAYTAISCNDTARGLTAAQIATTARRWTARYPLSGRWHAGLGDILPFCQQWQPVRTVPPKPIAATATKVLVIGNLHDPATPYQGAKDLAATLGNARLLTWNGEGHTSYLEGSSCIDNYVNQYLLTKALPPAGKVCPR